MAAVILTVVTIAVILALNRGKNKIPTKLAAGIIALEIIGTVISLSGGSGSPVISKIKRPAAGSASEEHEVTVKHGKKEEKLTIDVSGRKLTEKEAKKAVEEARSQIEEEYLGKNKSKSFAYRDLELKSKYDGVVKVNWYITPDIFDSEGKIDNSKVEKETEVTINGYLECESVTDELELKVTAVPIPIDTAEGLAYYINKAVTDAESADPSGEYVKLPKEVGGKKLVFTEEKEDKGIKLVIVMAFMLGLYLFYKRQKAKDDEKKWLKELSIDYPKMLSQLSLFIGAGFSVKAAFVQVGNAYIKRVQRGYPTRPAFEEIVRMNRRIKDGEDEEKAYKKLGESLRHKGFRKLTLLLVQSLKKGSRDLRDQLEQEERAAYDERRINAKVAGEEASLKLLLPMMGMLGVIFIVLMVPAFMQMT